MSLKVSISRRTRHRKLRSGEIVQQVRYVAMFRDPRTHERHQLFYERRGDAQAKAAELIAAYERGSFSASAKSLTVADAVEAWLQSKRGGVREITYSTYKFQAAYVVGTLRPIEVRLARARAGVGAQPKAAGVELLGRERVKA